MFIGFSLKYNKSALIILLHIDLYYSFFGRII